MCIGWLCSLLRRKEKIKSIPVTASMNIEEFVQASIVGIMSGIRGAQKEYSQGNSAFDPLICPAWRPPVSDLGGSASGYADKVYELEFDLAITTTATTTATSSSSAEVKAVVKVIGMYTGNIGISAKSEDFHSMTSRMRFKIPVRYPLSSLGKPDWNVSKD